MFIVHYFPDHTGRDLDNYIYKPLIDSLRKTGIFFDEIVYPQNKGLIQS